MRVAGGVDRVGDGVRRSEAVGGRTPVPVGCGSGVVAGREEGWIWDVGGFAEGSAPVGGRAEEVPGWNCAVGGLAVPIGREAGGRETAAGGWI